jgi:hypothetical protein
MRRSISYKQPKHKKDLKARAQTVLTVICMIAGAGITQPEFWQKWSTCGIGFAVYVERAGFKKLPDWWKPWVAPIRITATWGGVSLTRIEVALYNWALTVFPHARWLILVSRVPLVIAVGLSLVFCNPALWLQVSGDSIPTKPPSYYVHPPFSASVVGFWLQKLKDYQQHSQWKALHISDAQALCSKMPVADDQFWARLQDQHLEYSKGTCHSFGNPDEWAIGTFLWRECGVKLHYVNLEIMEQVMLPISIDRPCPKCGRKEVGHAQEPCFQATDFVNYGKHLRLTQLLLRSERFLTHSCLSFASSRECRFVGLHLQVLRATSCCSVTLQPFTYPCRHAVLRWGIPRAGHATVSRC